MTGRDVDVLIAGGGPAGASAAIALARRGRSVLLVDPARDRARVLGESLPPAAWPLLRELGVAERIAAAGHLVSHGTLAAWGSRELVPRDFVREPHGHGLQLDRRAFDAALLDHARSIGAEVVRGVRPAQLARAHGVPSRGARHVVDLAGAGAITARWVVDASGRGASIARRLGARRALDDRLIAWVAELRPARTRDLDSRLVIEAAPDGWWYCAPTPSGARIACALGDRDLVDHRALSSYAGFEAALATTDHLAPLLSAHGHALVGRPRVTSAASGYLVPWCSSDWLAAGDAALALDPLSSQGILNALYTGLRGGEAIADALDGQSAALAAYDRRLAAIRSAYLDNRIAIYAGERRWADRPFWRRRTGPR